MAQVEAKTPYFYSSTVSANFIGFAVSPKCVIANYYYKC